MSGRVYRRWIGAVVFMLCLGCIVPPCQAKPYMSAVSREHANGIVACIIRRVADKLDLSVEIRLAPFARRLRWMQTGKIDFMGGLLKRPERDAYIYFVSPPYVEKNRKVFYVRKGDEDRIKCYRDLYGLAIGTKIHSKYFPRFDRDRRLKKEAVSSLEQNFEKLLAGRIDAVIYSNRSGHVKLMRMGITDKVGLAPYVYTENNPVYIGISRRSPLMTQKTRIERVIRRMVENGEMTLIIENHYKYLPGWRSYRNGSKGGD